MHIKQLRIRNFRCFEDVTIDFDDDVNVFVGNNGSGKSAVLDAVAGAFYPLFNSFNVMGGKKRSTAPVTRGDLRIQNGSHAVEALLQVSTRDYRQWIIDYEDIPASASSDDSSLVCGEMFEDETDELPSLSDVEQDIEDSINDSEQIPLLAYYTVRRSYRSEKRVSSFVTNYSRRLDAFIGCLDAGNSYREMQEWFNSREIQELRKSRELNDLAFKLNDLEQIRSAVSRVIHPASRVYFSEQFIKPTLMVEWIQDNTLKSFTLDQLSDGYRNMLALVMDFARRMAQANPQMENPLEAEAILMIDEIDLHLHPTWQQRVIPDLKRAFPKTQIICTTHSPEVVSTVKGSQVRILEGSQVRACSVPTEGMKSSDVVRHVLGLDDLRPPDNTITRKIASLFDAIDNRELDKAIRIRDELRTRDPDRYDSDLMRAEVGIRMLERKQPK